MVKLEKETIEAMQKTSIARKRLISIALGKLKRIIPKAKTDKSIDLQTQP